VDWAGWAIFGLIATASLTGVMIGAQMLGFTRLDLPLVLGTVVTEDPDRARVSGFVMHLVIGQGFAFGYAATFALIGRSSWWLGGILGLIHVSVALTVLVPLVAAVNPNMATERAGRSATASLEPPGPFGRNYGNRTAAVTIVAHVLFGVALGIFLHAS
jgi:hypothetical protein